VHATAFLHPRPATPVTTVVLMRCWGRVRRRFDFDPSRKVWGYSKGNRQKINLIAALASRAGLLILDEPTAGLDPLMEQAFRESVLEARGNGRRCSCGSQRDDAHQ
jgi:ABC-type Na+ transport system ATPase subunit NatA